MLSESATRLMLSNGQADANGDDGGARDPSLQILRASVTEFKTYSLLLWVADALLWSLTRNPTAADTTAGGADDERGRRDDDVFDKVALFQHKTVLDDESIPDRTRRRHAPPSFRHGSL